MTHFISYIHLVSHLKCSWSLIKLLQVWEWDCLYSAYRQLLIRFPAEGTVCPARSKAKQSIPLTDCWSAKQILSWPKMNMLPLFLLHLWNTFIMKLQIIEINIFMSVSNVEDITIAVDTRKSTFNLLWRFTPYFAEFGRLCRYLPILS